MTETMKPDIKTAAELLVESERASDLKDRHRDYFVALAERSERELRGPDQSSWREMLESEYDNLRLALEWSLEQGASEEALRLAIAIDGIWYRRGDFLLARTWLERALAIDEVTPTPLRVNALRQLAELVWQNSHAEAFAIAQKALEVAKESGAQRAVFDALWYMSKPHFVMEVGGQKARHAIHQELLEMARHMGDEHAIADSLHRLASRVGGEVELTVGRELGAEALRLYRKLGDQENIAWHLYGNGWAEDPTVGRPLAEESLKIARQLKDDTLILCVIELLGWQLRFSGDYLGAVKVFEDAVEEYRRPGRKWPIPWGVSWMLAELAETELDMGKFESGSSHADEAVKVNEELEFQGDRPWPLNLQGSFAAARGDFVTARAKCEQSLALAREVGRGQLIAQALRALATAACWEGDYTAARAAAEESLSIFVPFGQGPQKAALERLGIIAQAQDDLEEARSFFGRALEVIQSRRWWPFEEPMIQLRLGRVSLASGEEETASALFGAALTRLQEIGHKPFAAWALEEFAALAAVRKNFERAGTLMGAAETIREETQAAVPIDQRRSYDETLDAIKAGLDEESVQKAWQVGRALSLDEAVLYALDGSNGT